MKRKLLCILLFVLSCGIMFSATYSGDFSLRLLKIGSNKTGFCRYDDAYNDNPDESALTVVDFTLAEQPSESETDSERATAQFGVFWDVYSGEASETNVNLKLSFSASDDNLNEAMLVNTEAEGSVLNYNVSAQIKDSHSSTPDETKTITVADAAVANPHPGLVRDIMLISNKTIGPYSQIKGGAKVDLELIAPTELGGSFMGGYYSGYVILTLDTE